MVGKKPHLLPLAICLLAGIAWPTPRAEGAQKESVATQTYTFNIEAGPMSRALATYSEVSGVQLVYDSEFVKGMRSTGLSGVYSAQEGLRRLLERSGLEARFTSPTTATVIRASTKAARILGPVRVEGAQGPTDGRLSGTNGSHDRTATEGTGSYTSDALTVGSKTTQSMKDTPQSVSVLTAQRIKDQNITDFTGALNQMTGVTLVQGNSSLDSTYFSRGFQISTFQIDGGAPLELNPKNLGNFGYFPRIDLSQYDHVELLRGAAGLYNGYGDPAGSLNLVRKKPLDHPQVTWEVQAGSWNNYRSVLDATAPLALDGKLRGRLVATYQQNKYFYDTARDDKTLIYGILSYDLTASTLLSGGVSFSREDSTPFFFGLPRYQNGDDLNLSRSTCLCFPWNRWDFETTERFATLEQQLGNRWQAKLNLTQIDQRNQEKYGYSTGPVNPVTHTGPVLQVTDIDYPSSQTSAEFTLSGFANVFGQKQELVVGTNYSKSEGDNILQYSPPLGSLFSGTQATPYIPYPGAPAYYYRGPNGVAPPIDVFHFDNGNPLYTEPVSGLPTQRFKSLDQTNAGAYLNLNLTAFDRWHLSTGVRYSQYKIANVTQSLCAGISQTCTSIGNVSSSNTNQNYHGRNFSWPPKVTLSYDITKSLSAYAAYTDIYVSQARYLDADLKPLAPVTGSNVEGGLKWQSRDGSLDVSLSAYRIEQKGFAAADESRRMLNGRTVYYLDNFGNRYNVNHQPTPGVDVSSDVVLCCYIIPANRMNLSQGFDLDLTGQVLPGWQASLGYTYNKNEQKGSYFGTCDLTCEGAPLVSRQPLQLLKLWSSYDLSRAGWGNRWEWLAGLKFSGGLHYQTAAFQAGSACTQFNPPGAQGAITCAVNTPYAYTQPAYATLAANAEYAISKVWSVSLNGENITDKRYYQTMGSSVSGNWYGAPANYTLALRAKW